MKKKISKRKITCKPVRRSEEAVKQRKKKKIRKIVKPLEKKKGCEQKKLNLIWGHKSPGTQKNGPGIQVPRNKGEKKKGGEKVKPR